MSRWYSIRNAVPGFNRDVNYRVPDTQRILHVTNEFFDAVATFERKDAIWRCIQADTAVEWIRKTHFDQLKNELLKRGCTWKWQPDVSPDLATVGSSSPSTVQEQLQTSLGTGNRD